MHISQRHRGINYFKGKVSRLGACPSYNVSPFDSIVYEAIDSELMGFAENFPLKSDEKVIFLIFHLYVPTSMLHSIPLLMSQPEASREPIHVSKINHSGRRIRFDVQTSQI
jgi:hypothetical protein